jgi:phosphodiesterase/alkaline phosphatase D-like protein
MSTFEAISAGSATSNSAVFWASTNTKTPSKGPLQLIYGEEQGGLKPGTYTTVNVASNANAGHTVKQLVTGLKPGTSYLYQFIDKAATSSNSAQGKIKTAPAADVISGVRFGFSGCASGRFAPINSVADVSGRALDFFVMLGDAAYEDSYKRADTDPRGGLNSPEVKPPFDPANPQATSQAKIKETVTGMRGKYRDIQNPAIGNLAPLYRSQGIVAAYDNHEMVDMALEAGGAPRTAVQTAITNPDEKDLKQQKRFFREGADITAANAVFNQSNSFLNKSVEHGSLLNAWFAAMPLQDLGKVNAPTDPRSNGTQKLYNAQQWGKNALFVNVDTRSYRDAKITSITSTTKDNKVENKEDDVTDTSIDTAVGADKRTMLGSTQLSWLKKTLLDAQTKGTTWKFVSLASPIDITGRPGQDGDFVKGEDWVDAKSWWGNYRYERNNLLKYIADNGIKNVVFIATDDHEARINEVTYVPTVSKATDLTDAKKHVKVPGAISVVASPLGAARPDAWQKDKDKKTGQDIVTASEQWSTTLSTAGYDPVGLTATEKLKLVSFKRQSIGNHTSKAGQPKPIDFWSPNTENYAVMDVNTQGQLTVSLRGIDATLREAWPAVGTAAGVGEILSFTLNPSA